MTGQLWKQVVASSSPNWRWLHKIRFPSYGPKQTLKPIQLCIFQDQGTSSCFIFKLSFVAFSPLLHFRRARKINKFQCHSTCLYFLKTFAYLKRTGKLWFSMPIFFSWIVQYRCMLNNKGNCDFVSSTCFSRTCDSTSSFKTYGEVVGSIVKLLLLIVSIVLHVLTCLELQSFGFIVTPCRGFAHTNAFYLKHHGQSCCSSSNCFS